MNNLGISFSGDHDTSCAIVVDSKLVFAISEERLTRVKNDGSFPINSIQACLNYAGLKSDEIDNVVIAWSHPMKQLINDLKLTIKNKLSFKSILYTLYGRANHCWIRGGFRRYEQYFGKANFIFCPHHLAHAISAFSYCDFNEATITVIDGRGAFEATSIWHGKNGNIKPVEIIDYPNSLGLFYAKFTKYLGFKPLSDEWKVMGLAPYGNKEISLEDFILQDKVYKVNSDKLLGNGFNDVSHIEKILGPMRNGSDITQHFKDVAYSVQKETESAMLNLVEYAIQKTGCRSLCLAGGVVMNCKANGLIANSDFVDQLFIQPAASDEGAALGAAYYPYLLYEKSLPQNQMHSTYLGPEYGSEEIQSIIESYKIPYQKLNNPSETISELLKDGNIIGLFQGRMEFGSRALGNRSIIADPRNPEMKDRVNNSVKYREDWRPFAPSILEENYDEYFDTVHKSPFMVLSFPIKKSDNDIPAATHVDNTSRPQSVSKKTNPFYWDLINEFRKKTGVPAILNTSFNLKGEPIVCSPFDAIRTFYTSGLDCLLLNNYLISK